MAARDHGRALPNAQSVRRVLRAYTGGQGLATALSLVLLTPAAARGACDYGPAYAAAAWTCAGGAAAGMPCSRPGDSVCVGGTCQIGTGGRATFYDYTGGGNCGLSEGPPGTFVTAVATPDWGGSAMCGRCLRVTGPLGTIVVKVVDQCPAATNPQWCADGGHLDLDDDAFAAVANPVQGIVEVSWETVPCEWPGDVQLVNKDGSNRWWYALFVEDHRHGIASVEIRDADALTWTTAQRQDYNAFLIQDSSGLDLDVSVRLTDTTGAVIESSGVVKDFAGGSTFDMGRQFPDCGPLVFSDDFESGDVSAWSAALP